VGRARVVLEGKERRTRTGVADENPRVAPAHLLGVGVRAGAGDVGERPLVAVLAANVERGRLPETEIGQ